MRTRDAETRSRKKDHEHRESGGTGSKVARDKDKSRPSHYTKSKLSSTSSLAQDREAQRDESLLESASSSSSSHVTHAKKQVIMVVPEMDRRRSDERKSTVYPSFSKAHSREAVSSRESIPKTLNTAEPADGGGRNNSDQSSKPAKSRSASGPAPPSPPLTRVEPLLRKAASGASMRRATHGEDTIKDYMPNATPSRGLRAGSSLRHAEEGRSAAPVSPKKSSSASLKATETAGAAGVTRTARASGSQGSLRARKTADAEPQMTDSDLTSVNPAKTKKKIKIKRKPPVLDDNNGSSPPSDAESSPPTPKGNDQPYSPFQQRKTPGSISAVPAATTSPIRNGQARKGSVDGPPPPPPPPPPAMGFTQAPRVDYLLQNGGLSQPVQRVFSSAARPPLVQQNQQYAPHSSQVDKAADIQQTFAPFSNLLENFTTVVNKGGSVAVATGYKSVARRLLDRLETVFARNISCESCPCALCRSSSSNGSYMQTDEDNGVSWGEVLELVSGRKELPQWPPFVLPSAENGLGLSHLDTGIEAPMQKLDIDVPEEYREHYIRQSQKTKQSVQRWLASQPEDQVTPPREVDDETLMFAMLTYLQPAERRIFTALMRGLSSIPESRAPTPAPSEPRTDFMARIGLAIQRLYRLPKTPREPECAMYLLKNPDLHSALATLSAINASEWEVLVSGRFDGFLWSGAEDGGGHVASAQSSTLLGTSNATPLSRGPTPFGASTSRLGTPSNAGPGPVAFDEETEIAVLAEVEREIYLGMEALEDAFEALHVKAEAVRRSLRERSTGLALQAQARRGQSEIEVRMGTPASASGWAPATFDDLAEAASETDDGMADSRSELAPDDSASNIGWREHNRRKERKKRREKETVRTRTPAVVEEEEEDSDPAPRRRRH